MHRWCRIIADAKDAHGQTILVLSLQEVVDAKRKAGAVRKVQISILAKGETR